MLNECIFSHSPSHILPDRPAVSILSLQHVTILCVWNVFAQVFKAAAPIIHIPSESSGGLRHIAPLLSASVPSLAKTRQVCRDIFLAECPPPTARGSGEGPGAGSGTWAQGSLGVVVNAGTCTSHSRESDLVWAPRGKRTNTYPSRGSHAATPDTRGGARRGGRCPRPRGRPWRREALPFRFRPRGKAEWSPRLGGLALGQSVRA